MTVGERKYVLLSIDPRIGMAVRVKHSGKRAFMGDIDDAYATDW